MLDLYRLVYRFEIEMQFITLLKFFTLKYRLNSKYAAWIWLTVL